MASASVSSPVSSKRVGDYLLTGMFAMLAINGVQRIVGLVRGLGFCHFLTEDQLGSWALVNSFFIVGVPVVLLGLPGSFSKFVEYYRHRNQLGDYLVNVLMVTCVGLLVAIIWMLGFQDSFTWLVFHQQASFNLTIWCVLAFASVVVFSFVYDLTASLREVRVISIMQFVQSVVFAAVGLTLLALYQSWIVLLPSYAIACVLASLPGLWVLYLQYRAELAPSRTLDQYAMWTRIVPFAASLWVMNLLSNTFELSDRYMLLHLSQGGPEVGQALVGQYHCGRILPNLLTSVALMLGGVLLPYLSADWEVGNRARIAARIKHITQGACVGLMAVSVGAQLVAPYLFAYGFEGRYAGAEAIMPVSLLHAIWVSLFLITESYMLCAERGRELALLLLCGLAVNLGLNWILIQEYGLSGAVTATTLAGFLTLMLLFWRLARNGCPVSPATVVLCISPVAVVAGPTVTAVVLAVIVAIAGRTEWLLTQEDRQQLDEFILPKLARYGVRLGSLWL